MQNCGLFEFVTENVRLRVIANVSRLFSKVEHMEHSCNLPVSL